MNWASIIAILLELFGPAVVAWLKEWLDNLFNRASLTLLDPAAYDAAGATPINGTEALYEKAIWLHEGDRKKLWWFQWYAKWKHDRRTDFLLASKPIALRAIAQQRTRLTVAEQEVLAARAAEAA